MTNVISLFYFFTTRLFEFLYPGISAFLSTMKHEKLP
jgi:hypothetical protein